MRDRNGAIVRAEQLDLRGGTRVRPDAVAAVALRRALGVLLPIVAAGCADLTDLDVPATDAGGGEGCEAVRCAPMTRCEGGVCVPDDPCAGVACEAPGVCSAGSCVNRLADEDADGFPASSDCDDHDPRVWPGTAVACASACGEGAATCGNDRQWTSCTAPADCWCEVGETRTEACGRCGSATRACGADGTWGTTGPCEAEGECRPPATDTRPCGACGHQSRTCTAGCSWNAFGDCEGEGECSPGAVETETCGACGTRSRTCQGGCGWGEWSACAGEGCADGNPNTEDSCDPILGCSNVLTCAHLCRGDVAANCGPTHCGYYPDNPSCIDDCETSWSAEVMSCVDTASRANACPGMHTDCGLGDRRRTDACAL
jgi:hypothetical protein